MRFFRPFLCLLSLPIFGMAAPASACVVNYKEDFRKLDVNHNGVLEASELKKIPKEYRKAVLVGIDSNEDHKVDMQEYVDYREEDTSQPQKKCRG